MKSIFKHLSKTTVIKSTPAEFSTQQIDANIQSVQDDAFYVANMGDIVEKHRIWSAQLPRVHPFYAVKCNDDLTTLSLLALLGTGFDCASKKELKTVLDLDVPASRIIYANPCKQASHIKYAEENHVETMTFDNEAELHKVKKFHPNAKMVVRILPPVSDKCTINLGEKFGCKPTEVPQLLRVAKELGINVVGVAFHVGSGCYEANAYMAAVATARLVFDMAIEEGFQFSLLDIGGGFPGHKYAKLSFTEICAVLRPALDEYFPESMKVRIIGEPGRYFVSSAFSLAVSVIARRVITTECNDNSNVSSIEESSSDESDGDGDEILETQEVISNKSTRSFMYYLNDGVYGAFQVLLLNCATVEPMPFCNGFVSAPRFKSTLWGPTCDSFDCLAKDRLLPELCVGDWMLFETMGAYTMTCSTNFNGMSKPKCYYVMPEQQWLSVCRAKGLDHTVLSTHSTMRANDDDSTNDFGKSLHHVLNMRLDDS
jgi:ornithine decarboxylase